MEADRRSEVRAAFDLLSPEDRELLELRVVAKLSAEGPDGQVTASATGIRTGIGRTVRLRTDELPILHDSDLYELWFVGPGDPRTPNRISAGTFHPDEDGRSHVNLTAAVNAALYPTISITAEPGDGDPAPNGPEVLRSTVILE